MSRFNENTRVKFPATIQFMRLGYQYQSLNDDEIDFDTKIFRGRFHKALEKINKRKFTDIEIESVLKEINELIFREDMGKAFYYRLIMPNSIKLIDFDNYMNNDFAVTCELPFNPKKGTLEGSFRPDIVLLINGIPLGFLEVKIPNNCGGIQKEFHRMLNDRLKNPAFKKYFNLIQFVTFSNNMEYERSDDTIEPEQIRQGSFYSTPNGFNTYFNFFREGAETRKTTGFIDITADEIRNILRDNQYNESEYDEPEFQTNLDINSPCNKFVTSFFDPERLIFLLQYGFCYVNEKDKKTGLPIVNKHIMRYPQFFAAQAILKRLESGEKRGIIWHTQGSGKTELAAYANRIIRDYYAKQGVVTRFYFVVDRLDLLIQASGEFESRGLIVNQIPNKNKLEEDLTKPIDIVKYGQTADIGCFTVVNVQKLKSNLKQAQNNYGTKVQRIFFIDECHRSYKQMGTYFVNLMTCDTNGVFIALTGTPILSKTERSNLKFGDYIHKYFYGDSIADGYTLRIKKETIDKVKREQIKENLELEDPDTDPNSVLLSNDYVDCLCKYIADDFRRFRLMNQDNTTGAMIVCDSNQRARQIGKWFENNTDYTKGLRVGVVISSDEKDDEPMRNQKNKELQRNFKYNGTPDILIVHQMLTTGYDVHRLKKMYLLRNAHAQSLLQTISRVNRPYKAPSGKVYNYGYITDFVDINEEFERTIGSYIDELEKDANIDEEGSLKGVVVSTAEIYEKYQKYYIQVQTRANCSGDKEIFSQSLNSESTSDLQELRKDLQTCISCYAELRLAGSDLADRIDDAKLKSWLQLVQNRIHLRNLRDDSAINMLAILNDEEIVDVVYEFVKTNPTIMNLGNLANADKNPDLDAIIKNINHIHEEIAKNHNRNQSQLVKLDKVLSEIFKKLDIHDENDLFDIKQELKEALDELHRINEENDRLAQKYGGEYAFVISYTMLCEQNPDIEPADIESIMTTIYNAIKENTNKNHLLIQGRDNFIRHNERVATISLVKSGLWKKLSIKKEWLDDVLNKLYTNLQLI